MENNDVSLRMQMTMSFFFVLFFYFLDKFAQLWINSWDGVNVDCPGTQSEAAGKTDACQSCPNQEACATAPKGSDPDLVAIAERMATVKNKILVLSGKGGVEKSTFSARLSFALTSLDFQVSLLDIDICGPSIPKLSGDGGQTGYTVGDEVREREGTNQGPRA